MNVSREQLENAPGFDKDNWPDVEEFDWVVPVYEYYDVVPFWV